MRRALAVVALLALAGCERVTTQLDAAEDIRVFLLAVEQRDRAAFDAHVDRAALKADLRRQIAAQGGAGALLAQSGPGERILDGLISPESFSLAVERAAPALNRTPTAPEIAAVLKTLDANRVCLPNGGLDGPCAVTFAKQGETWKLVSVAAVGMAVQQLPFPSSAAG